MQKMLEKWNDKDLMINEKTLNKLHQVKSFLADLELLYHVKGKTKLDQQGKNEGKAEQP